MYGWRFVLSQLDWWWNWLGIGKKICNLLITVFWILYKIKTLKTKNAHHYIRSRSQFHSLNSILFQERTTIIVSAELLTKLNPGRVYWKCRRWVKNPYSRGFGGLDEMKKLILHCSFWYSWKFCNWSLILSGASN